MGILFQPELGLIRNVQLMLAVELFVGLMLGSIGLGCCVHGRKTGRRWLAAAACRSGRLATRLEPATSAPLTSSPSR
jgi:uncharacterized membrane protein YdcZ (DUF606 family)